MIDLLLEAMARHPEAKGFLIDGFPANLEQAAICQEKLGKPEYVLWRSLPLNYLFLGKSLFLTCPTRS